jgi:dUTP pyrophosphatase
MKVKIKRIDKNLPLPEYKTKGAVAFDLYSRKNISIKSRNLCLIPTNFIIKTPASYALLVLPRSSTPKRGLLIPHGVGIVDCDYCGEEDEILFQVLNFTDKTVKIKKGERIAQAIFVKFAKARWLEVKKMDFSSRGGFGSTGK